MTIQYGASHTFKFSNIELNFLFSFLSNFVRLITFLNLKFIFILQVATALLMREEGPSEPLRKKIKLEEKKVSAKNFI